MGNCQASDAVVIHHPGGRVERLYWPTSAADVMKSNPGYHVALVTLCVSEEKQDAGGGAVAAAVRVTRVRLLKPKDVLLIGQVYRLVASQEVAVALRARKHQNLKNKGELIIKQQQQQESTQKVTKYERARQKSSTKMAARGRQWRPSLQSISELGS
ncbi:hypothetical protein Cni_G02812 [Canna indica]|uniref:Uncharacterized protein n=1 Tax=Canna indica TaxID=4628 RepID=A0AAQ3Q0E2_9LILI|nr:hypothetical protein Cni_G02812 [Canna indica]